MKPSWQRWLHRCARASGWVAGVTLILLAVTAALAQLLLPLLARNPEWVATQLSTRLQRPVGFASMEGHWTPSGPNFVLHGVKIGTAPGQGGAMLQLPESEVKIDFGGWLLPSRHLINLHVRGLQLDLQRRADGWHVNGIGTADGSDRQPLSLGPVSADLWLEDLRISVADTVLDKRYILLSKQLRLSRHGDQLRFGGVLRREGANAAIHSAGRFSENGRSGQVWVSVDGAELQALLDGVELGGYAVRQGHGKLSAWLDWEHGQLSRSLIRLDLDTLAVSSATGKVSVNALHGLAGVQKVEDGYRVRWAGSDGGALVLDVHQPGTANLAIDAVARKLQLAPLLPWLAMKPGLSPALSQWLGDGHPRGEVQQLRLHWSRATGLRTLNLGFHALAIEAVGKLPGVSGLDGELRGDAEALSLSLPTQATTLEFAHALRQPLDFSAIGGTLAFWSQDGQSHIGIDTLDFTGAGYAGHARGEVALPAGGGAPFVDLYASLDHADVTAAKLFWPVGKMSPGTIGWLDNALQAGQLDEAQVLLRGDLHDWPFRHNEGRFEARAVIRDLTLDYGRDWPHAENVNAVASFVNNGMLVEVSGGHSLGVTTDHAVALIPDFSEPLLDLNARGSGSGASLLEFVRKSPVGSHQADTLAKLKLGGSASFGFHLVLPMNKDEHAAPQLDGVAQLKQADLSAPEWNLKLDKLNGPLTFDLHGMQAGPLAAGFRGQPSTLRMAIADGNADPSVVLSAQLTGDYRMDELVRDYPALAWLGKLSEGRAPFDIGFTIARVAGSDTLDQRLSVDSSLQGIALNLPAPVRKGADETMPLHLTMSLPVGGGELRFGLGDAVRGYLRLADGEQRPMVGTLALGTQMPTTLPQHDLRIRGHAARLDVTGWVQQLAGGSGAGGPGLESLDISTDQAQWFGSQLGPLKLRAQMQPEVLNVDVDGPAMLGNYSVPRQELDKRGVTARLKRMYWPKTAKVEAPRNVHKDATTQATTQATIATAASAGKAPAAGAAATATATATPAPVVPVEDPANTGINPASLPPFHLWVGDLRLGDAKLGEARLETWPTPDGLHIEQLRALSSRVQINGSGDWNGDASSSHTHMRINFAAEDLGDMLGALGFDGLVHGGKTRDLLDARWPGSPSGLSLATMDGTLSIQVNDGRIPEAASPGVGRLLGLVSLTELPRRLTLDFGDVFGKGLAFDSISGDFKLADGNATTTNLVIDGPAANIKVTGRTGLRAKDYDQQMLVIPHVGNSLPLVGAVVGGPIGAAAGFAVQGLLGKGLNQAASARYRITGSWDEPVITLLEKHAATPPPAPLLSPGSNPPAESMLAPAAASSAPIPPAAPSSTAPAASSSVQQ